MIRMSPLGTVHLLRREAIFIYLEFVFLGRFPINERSRLTSFTQPRYNTVWMCGSLFSTLFGALCKDDFEAYDSEHAHLCKCVGGCVHFEAGYALCLR